ncbi:ABC transporter ATP-binding protein [Paenibacillus thermoaerophilus]|uniref:ABC transporter ATP-binding protein n=1 Tax=Paenibacillus thermoaerophilus TaxID=1215385 RepID=A0ABW2V2J2_9BACL|nr:ABC transporter ATP-binding protein [Paenibacillus thermoaerophilus]TMV17363.1 ABC transporter ATP-binding protein [Paenibacillus thermoaerophilus]
MALVSFRDALKKYDSRITVNHLTLDIGQGEIFGLLGPNGAGKSTSIRMAAGLLPLDGGDITLDGRSVRSQPLEVKRRLGLVPQELAIYEQLTAWENVAFFGRLYGLRGKLLKQRVEEALGFVGLADRAGDKPHTFSGGMKRRLNIACAITHRPMLIIMDEPTVGIDPHSRNHILESVRELNRLGSTVIYTTHYMEEVEAICTRIGIIDQGKLIASGTKDQLRRQAGQDIVLSLETDRRDQEAIREIRSHPRIRHVSEGDGGRLDLTVDDSPTVLQDVLFILNKHQVSLKQLTRNEPNLESLFLHLTGRSLRDA